MIPFSYVFNNFMILGFLQWCFSFTYRRVDNFILQSAKNKSFDSDHKKTMSKYSKFDVLIIDDFLISSVQEREAHHIFQLFEYRYGLKSTIVCSQLEPSEWHHNLGGNLIADSILDRIIPQCI